MARPTGSGNSIDNVMKTHNDIDFQEWGRKGAVNKLQRVQVAKTGILPAKQLNHNLKP